MSKPVLRLFRNTKILFPTIIFTVLLIGFSVVPSILINLGYNDIFNFKLLAVAGVVNPEIKCSIKELGFTQKQNIAGTVISQGEGKHSKMYIKNPTTFFGLDILDKEGIKDPITSFKVYPKIKCEVKSQLPLQISPTDLTLEVFSQNEKQTKVLTYTATKRISPITLTNNHEETLAEFIVDPFVIEQKLGTTGYNSYQEFRISGNVNLNYVNYPTVKYQVTIPKDTVKITFYTAIGTIVDDGIPSPNCPSNKLLKDGICVPICSSSEMLVNNVCVPKPPTCNTDEELIDNKCVPKPPKPPQNDPKVEETDETFSLLADWFSKLLAGDFASLQQSKYMGINLLVGGLVILGLISTVKPRNQKI